jgi:hypothetical protein
MCCFFTTLVLLGPRIGILVYWLLPYGQARFNLAFSSWLWPLLGIIFLPWTTLMYVIVFPITGFDWIWLAIALFADIGSYTGGAYGNRNQMPGYGRAP